MGLSKDPNIDWEIMNERIQITDKNIKRGSLTEATSVVSSNAIKSENM